MNRSMTWSRKFVFLIDCHLPVILPMNTFLTSSGWLQNFILSCHTIPKLLPSDETCSTTYPWQKFLKVKASRCSLLSSSNRNLLGPLQSFSFLTSFPSKVFVFISKTFCSPHPNHLQTAKSLKENISQLPAQGPSVVKYSCGKPRQT